MRALSAVKYVESVPTRLPWFAWKEWRSSISWAAAEKPNEAAAATDGGAGWVSKFHEALRQLLSQFKGGEPQIWLDEKLRGNDVFADEIVDQFSKTATLVSVLTPQYLESDWCTREIREFCGAAQQTGGVVVHNKARVFKLIKTPFAAEDNHAQQRRY